MTALLALACAALGLGVGTFLTVVVDRVPQRVSLARPPARCSTCSVSVAPKDQVPVLSWLTVRRCRSCCARIPVREPLVELFTAGLFAVMTVRFGADWALPAFLVFAAALVAVTVIDLERAIIPNRVVYPALGTGVVLLVVAAVLGHDGAALAAALVGAAAAFALFLLIHLASPEGMGFGDVRLSALVGLHLGWLGLGHVALAVFTAFLGSAAVAVPLLLFGRRGRKSGLPFGPFLALGAVVAVVAGRGLLDWSVGR